MTESVGIFIDGANVYYGLQGTRINFARFKTWLAAGREVTAAAYFNAKIPELFSAEGFHNHLRWCGFKVFVRLATKNSVTGQWKQEGIDVYLSVKAMAFADKFDKFILVSGDYDYLPLIEELRRMGKSIEIISFKYCMHPIYQKFEHRFLDDYLELSSNELYRVGKPNT